MPTLFIADLHLSAERPDITGAFLRFMKHEAPSCDALYVLGDLFDVWIGDDDDSEFNQLIIDAFATLSRAGVPCYFIHGNRDFLLGPRFAKQSGIQLLPQHHVIDLYGQPTLIMHGDSLCTRDTEYMQFRRKARGWWWPRLMLAMPLWYRRKVARKARQRSTEGNAIKPEEIMDVTPEEVVNIMRETGVQQLIHGHTHRPAVHHFSIDEQPAQRIVLGDWYDQGSVLVATPESLELTERPLVRPA